MKSSIRILSAVLAALFLLCGTAFAGVWGEGGIPVDVTLEEIGSYPVLQEGEEDSVDWSERTEGLIKAMLYNRTPAITLLSGGYYVVDGGGSEVNRVGLFDEQGAQLIPFEAAIIRRLGDHSGEDAGRYLAVYYATEKTEDRNKALLYLSDGSWIGGNIPREGDTMYEGYIRFYDLELRRFVPELQATGPVSACGDLLALNKDIYDAEGRQVAEKRAAGNGYLIRNTSPKEVYDASLTLRFTSELQLSVFPSTSGYLLQYAADQGYQILDIDGKPVVQDWFKSVYDEKYGLICAQRADGAYVLETTDGRVLAESDRRITCLAAGYYYTEDGDSFTMVGADGPIASGLRRPRSNLQAFDKETGKDAHTLVLGTGELSLPFGGGVNLGIGMVRAYSPEDNSQGAFDLFTGEQLLPFGYDEVSASGGLVYADAEGVRHVFRPRYQYR